MRRNCSEACGLDRVYNGNTNNGTNLQLRAVGTTETALIYHVIGYGTKPFTINAINTRYKSMILSVFYY